MAADPNGYVIDMSIFPGKDGTKDKCDISYGIAIKQIVLDVVDVIQKYYPTKKLYLSYDSMFYITQSFRES